jgi:hypothetical protein
MPEPTRHRNNAVIGALLLGIAALAANFVFFVNPPLQAALPWVSLGFAVAALIALLFGLWLAFARSQVYRGKALSVVLGVLTLMFSGASLFAFFHARALPGSKNAPQIGQKAPDFTLDDTGGKPVSLDSLFLPQAGDAASAAPKAVLLIFYRGYW